MPITALPTPPSRQDPANFSTRADAFLGALPTFATEANSTAADVNASQSAATASAVAAAASQTAAAASAASAANSATTAAAATGAPAWVSGTTYALGAVVYSNVNARTYRRIIAGAGTTDPSADATNWRAIGLDIDTAHPTIRPTLNLDFANTEVLDSRITFTRASEGRVYDGRTFAKAEENLLIRSQEFGTDWFGTLASITSNTSAAPDGTTTADTFSPTASAGVHNLSQTDAIQTGVTRTLSIFAKAGAHSFIQLAFGGDVAPFANFDLTLGTVGTTGSSSTASIVNVGNGWYRCILTTTSLAASGARFFIVSSASAVRGESWTTAGTETVLIWGGQLELRSTVTAYTPTTTQPITNYIPQLMTAAAGVARFDHNPLTTESLGLLIEEQRTNLFVRSAEIDNATWTKTRSSITANAAVAPDGTLTADRLVEDTSASNTHLARQDVAVTSGTTYTFSIYAKASGRTQIQIGFGTDNSAFPDTSAIFTLSGNGAATVNTGSPNPTITPVGNDWYRCSIVATASATATGVFRIFPVVSSNAFYTGDGYSGIFIWGAQLEAGAFPTSYIPTVAAQVTRQADAASMTGVNFSSWYRQAEGSFVVNAIPNQVLATADSSNRIYFGVGDSSLAFVSGNTMYMSRTASAANLALSVISGGVAQYSGAAVGGVQGAAFQFAFGYKLNDFAVSRDAGAVSTDTVAIVPPVSSLALGSSQGLWSGALAPNNNINGHIRKLAYYPARLTNAQLQAITTP